MGRTVRVRQDGDRVTDYGLVFMKAPSNPGARALFRDWVSKTWKDVDTKDGACEVNVVDRTVRIAMPCGQVYFYKFTDIPLETLACRCGNAEHLPVAWNP